MLMSPSRLRIYSFKNNKIIVMLASRLSMKFSQPILQNQQLNRCHRRNLKVSVVGAAGGIGQNLSMLLKLNPHIETLVLHDKVSTKGIAADLSHICTNSTVKFYSGKSELEKALTGSDIVVVTAGSPRKLGMSREDLLALNANVASSVALAVSSACPSAFLAFITNPVNTIVPIVKEILKSKDSYDPKRLFGVTSLDVLRTKAFLAKSLKVDGQQIEIPVIGGHSGITILPLLSQCKPAFEGGESERIEFIQRVRYAGTEVMKSKADKGSATLSMAHAGAEFVGSLIKAIKNQTNETVIECAYVESNVTPLKFFSTPILLGPKGIKENLGLPEMDELEKNMLQCLMPALEKNIEVGVKYAKNFITSGY